jgi:hypothetical protein
MRWPINPKKCGAMADIFDLWAARNEQAQPRGGGLRSSTAIWSEAAIPQRPWIVNGFLLRQTVTLLAGAGSAGKSSLMIGWAVSMALGLPYGRFKPEKPRRVLSYNVEDDEFEQQRRMSAALRQFNATPADLGDRIMRVTPEEIGTLMEHDQATGTFRFTKAWGDLERLISEFKPDVIILDPLAELHTAEENNNTALRHVLAYIRSLTQRFDCAAVVIHHIRKGGEAGDMDAVRGAGSLVGAARTVFTVTPMSPEEADTFGIAHAQRRGFFRLDNAKANYVEAGEAAWHELQGYELDNGEIIAAALPWAPDVSQRPMVEPDTLALIMAAVARGTDQGPYSPRLSLDQPRSIAVLFQRHGITTTKGQRIMLDRLLQDGVTVQEFTDHLTRRKTGLRMPDGRPKAPWIEPQANG